MKAWILVAALTSVLAGSGCSSPDGDASDTTADAVVGLEVLTPGSFKLFAQPRPGSQADCDVHTVLELANTPRATAFLSEGLGEGCRAETVVAHPRRYALKLAGRSCGSELYTAVDGDGVTVLAIVDHRARTCEDEVPAEIILRERSHDGAPPTTLFSDDR